MRNSIRAVLALILTVPVQLLLYLTMNNVDRIIEEFTVESIFYTLIFVITFALIFWVIKTFIDEINADFNIDEFKNLLDKNEEFYEDIYHQEDLDEFT